MRNASFKKFVALATVATMLLSSATVFAAESGVGDTEAGSTIPGTGAVEDFIDKDVFRVILPTVSNVNFTLDPQGLLKIADSSKYAIGAGAVYFANAAGTYTNTSDAIEIANKSSYDVDVAFSIEVTLPEGISLVEQTALASATTPSVYLGLAIDSGDATALTPGVNNAAVQTLDAVPEAASTGYEIKATGSDGNFTYTYELGDGFQDSSADKVAYTLTGACDTTADWSSVKDLEVTASIVWECAKTGTLEDEEEVVEPTEAVSTWDGGSDLWVAISDDGGLVDTEKLTSVKIKDDSMSEFAAVEYTLDDSQGWMSIAWDDIIEAGGSDEATSWTVQFVYDSTTYEVTNTGE